MSRTQRQLEKAALLRQIQLQRRDLAGETHRWLETMAPYDRGWQSVVKLRKLLLVGSGMMALYNLRHPNHVLRWSRYGLQAWSSIKLIRQVFYSR